MFNYLHWRQTLLGCKHALKSPLIWEDKGGGPNSRVLRSSRFFFAHIEQSKRSTSPAIHVSGTENFILLHCRTKQFFNIAENFILFWLLACAEKSTNLGRWKGGPDSRVLRSNPFFVAHILRGQQVQLFICKDMNYACLPPSPVLAVSMCCKALELG